MVSTNVSNFPYDVCECIAQYLPDVDLRALRAINHAFDDLWRLRSFREVTLNAYWTILPEFGKGRYIIPGFSIRSRPFSHHDLDEFTSENSAVARYVRSLRLCFALDINGSASRIWSQPRGLVIPPGFKNMKLVASDVNVPPEQIKKLFCCFSQLEEFTIILERSPVKPGQGHIFGMDPPDVGFFGPILRWLLPEGLFSLAAASSIRTLTICMPIEGWSSIFVPDLHIEKLEKLVLLPNKDNLTWTHDADTLIRFMQRHSRTLRHLKLVGPDNTFFTKFPYLVSLQSIEIEEPSTTSLLPVDSTELHGFLQRQSSIITRIRWGACTSSTGLGHHATAQIAWFDLGFHPQVITFPKLRTLELNDIDRLRFKPRFEDIGAVLTLYNSTLTKLCLEGYQLDSEPLILVLDSIASPILRHLEISIRYLKVETFLMMAEKLPHLDILRIEYASEPWPSTIAFTLAMKHCYFSCWSVREITLYTKNEGTLSTRTSWDIDRAVAWTLPHLYTLNEIPVKEYFY